VRHAVLDQWSRRDSFLHRRDPRAKIIALAVFLVAVATTHGGFGARAAAYFAVLVVALAWARLPVAGALGRAAVVLPFSLAFAAVTALAGDSSRAVMLVVKSYLSAAGVLLLVSTTPIAELLRGLERLGAPPFLVMVAQFLYRYLFVITDEARNMRVAGAARGGTLRSARFRAAAGALAVLFARSYARAGEIHRAMLARGFDGRFRLLSTRHFGWRDAGFLFGAVLVIASIWGFNAETQRRREKPNPLPSRSTVHTGHSPRSTEASPRPAGLRTNELSFSAFPRFSGNFTFGDRLPHWHEFPSSANDDVGRRGPLCVEREARA